MTNILQPWSRSAVGLFHPSRVGRHGRTPPPPRGLEGSGPSHPSGVGRARALPPLRGWGGRGSLIPAGLGGRGPSHLLFEGLGG